MNVSKSKVLVLPVFPRSISMSWFLPLLCRLRRSPRIAAFGSSAYLHAAAVLAACLWVRTDTEQVGLQLDASAGSQPILLTASWADPTPEPPTEISAADFPVTISPDRARVADQTFVRMPADLHYSAAREAAILQRLMELPPPAVPSAEPPRSEELARHDPPPPLTRAALRPSVLAEVDAIAQAAFASGAASRHDALPRPRENPPPEYPPQAIAARQQGTVVLRLHISRDGRVERLELIESSGHASLDGAAATAVMRWRFDPARSAGLAVPATVRLPVRFALQP